MRSELVARSLPLSKAAQRMGLTIEGLNNLVQRGKMLTFPEGNENLVPIELIDDTREDRTVQGLSDVIEASTMTPFALAMWLLHPAASLGGRRPVDELRAGGMWGESCAQLRVSALRRRSKLQASRPSD